MNVYLMTGLRLDKALQGFRDEVLYPEDRELTLNLLYQCESVRAIYTKLV